MQIICVDSDFCSGVERAINLCLKEKEFKDTVYTLGQIIHNDIVVKNLEDKGIIPITVDNIPNGATLVINAHGISKNIYNILKEKGISIIDATCPYVKRIHKKVDEYSNNGYFIYIVGKADHREVEGIAGFAGNKYKIILSPDEFSFFPNEEKYLIVFQTTVSMGLFVEFNKRIEYLLAKHKKTVEIFNSICYTTVEKQKSAEKLSLICDAVFVIGSIHSSNTMTLFETVSKNTASYLISQVSDILSVTDIKNITKLGIIPSASAPKELIMEVINRMNQDNTQGVLNIKDVESVSSDELTNEAVSTPEATAKDENNTLAEVTVEATSNASADLAVEAELEVLTLDEAVEVDKTKIAAEVNTNADVAVETKKEVKPEKKKIPQELNTMAQAMKSEYVKTKQIREGARLKAKIVSIDPTGVSVSVEGAGKNDIGFIDKQEMELDGSYNPDSYNIGDLIDTIVIPKTDSKMKGTNLSKKLHDSIKIEDEAVKKILEGEEFSLACTKAINGGLLGKLGTYTIFVPASQIKLGYVKNLEEYVGKKLRLRILPPKEEEVQEGQEARKPNPKRIVASQRIILEEERMAREAAFWEVMEVNNIIKGKVKRFTPFGAFVSIMNFDCLAHISDLSWVKINDPSEVLEINKSYDFLVTKVDRENSKVSLGYKQLMKKPYELAAEKYHVGDVIKGKVERIKDFGAFVEIEPGIDGLVHVSEIGNRWVANANEILKVGEEIEAKIVGFENNKITLSMKALLPAEEFEAEVDAVQSEDTVEGEDAAEGKKPNKTSQSQKFNKRMEAADSQNRDKKDRRSKRDKSDEDDGPRQWVSSSKSGATLADLFKNTDLDNMFEDKE